jgi:hypothetical protein
MSKFKVGDKVRFVNKNGAQSWAEGVEFTVEKFNKDKLGNSSGWYQGSDATRYGEPFDAYDNDLGNSGGIWEENLELVEKSLEDQLADAEKIVAELKQKLEERDAPVTKRLPIGSVISTGVFQYVKLADNTWQAILTESGEPISAYLSGFSPYGDDRFIGKVEVIREGI